MSTSLPAFGLASAPTSTMHLELLAEAAARAAPLPPPCGQVRTRPRPFECLRLPGVAALDAGRVAHHRHRYNQQHYAVAHRPAQPAPTLAPAPLFPSQTHAQAQALTSSTLRLKRAPPLPSPSPIAPPPSLRTSQVSMPTPTPISTAPLPTPLHASHRMLYGVRRGLTDPSTRLMTVNSVNGLYTRSIPTYMSSVKLDRSVLKPSNSINTQRQGQGLGYLYNESGLRGIGNVSMTTTPSSRLRNRTLSLAPAPLTGGGVLGGGRVYKRTSTNTSSGGGGRDETHVCKVVGCGKRFARAYGLRMHGRKHTNESPYVCRVSGCGERFKWRSSLRHHSRTRHKSNGSGNISASSTVPL